MAQLMDSIVYRLAGLWWPAIYAALCDGDVTRRTYVSAAAERATPSGAGQQIVSALS